MKNRNTSQFHMVKENTAVTYTGYLLNSWLIIALHLPMRNSEKPKEAIIKLILYLQNKCNSSLCLSAWVGTFKPPYLGALNSNNENITYFAMHFPHPHGILIYKIFFEIRPWVCDTSLELCSGKVVFCLIIVMLRLRLIQQKIAGQ